MSSGSERRCRRWAAVFAATIAAPGCGAYMSWSARAAELDSVLRWDELGADAAELRYREDPERRVMLARALGPVSDLFGVDASPHPMDNPRGFAREHMLELTAEAVGDVDRTLHLSQRLLLIAELDASGLGRLTALECLVRLAVGLELDLIAGVFEEFDTSEETVAAIERLQRFGPVARPQAPQASWREAYLAAIARVTDRPGAAPTYRRRLVTSLAEAAAADPDPGLGSRASVGAVEALRWAVQRALVDAMTSDAPSLEPVRSAAIRQFRRVGGPGAVAVILALKERPASVVASGLDRFDSDPMIRLELVNMCGQLQGELAASGAQRSADAADRGPSPQEFLYEQVARPDEAMPGLRLEALEALGATLGRTPDFDADWAHRWWLERAGGP